MKLSSCLVYLFYVLALLYLEEKVNPEVTGNGYSSKFRTEDKIVVTHMNDSSEMNVQYKLMNEYDLE